MKICIIGAGSTYTPELIEGVINKRDSLPVTAIDFMDIDERKLNIVGGLCQRMIKAAGLPCETRLILNDYETALRDSDFVLAQIRVGKLPARVKDEKIPLKYNLIGQETCGIGGMFKGLRTIPVMMNIVKMMEKYCPNAWLINFSNPSGMIAEALLNYTNVKMMGLCNVPINTIDSIKKGMNLPNAKIEYMGLNHFAYITKIEQDGKDYLQEAIESGFNSATMKNIPTSGFTKEQIEVIGAIPTCYLEYYYFKNSKLEKLKNSPKTRGEVCMEIEEELLKIYQDNELHVKPAQLSKRGGARYSEVAINLVDSIWNDKQDVQVVNVLNKGAIPFLRDNDAVEICAIIGKDGAKPLPLEGKVNDHIKEYIQQVKAYEKHAVKAAINGDKKEAMRALMSNPLVADLQTASDCFDELLEAHKEYLPQFFKENK